MDHSFILFTGAKVLGTVLEVVSAAKSARLNSQALDIIRPPT